MSDAKDLPGETPAPQPCTAMHPTASRRQGLIIISDGTDTSKCPYMDVCNQPRCRAIMADRGVNSGTERCMVHGALSCTLEVGR
jgi:hypothetical protein